MIKRIYQNILTNERLLDLDIYIKDYQSFEEIPLVTRFSSLRFLDELIEKSDFQSILINTAFFVLKNVDLYARSNLSTEEYRNYFICLTFPSLDDIDVVGYAIPHFFITRKIGLLGFLRFEKNDYTLDVGVLEDGFKNCGMLNIFSFIKVLNKDEICGDFYRIYAVDSINREKCIHSGSVDL